MTQSEIKVRVKARTILQKYGLQKIIPIRLGQLCRELGIKICHTESIHIDGTLLIHKGQKIILVSLSLPHERRRFTVAHELGHYLLSHQRAAFSLDSPESWCCKDERAANAFAAEILMPKIAIQSLHYKHTTRDLAKIFKVSSLAMQIRLEELGINRHKNNTL